MITVFFIKSKRASKIVYQVMIQLIIVMFVFAILMSYVKSVEKDTLFEKDYLAKDMALIIDANYAAPGEIDYSYKNTRVDIKKFNFEFKDQKLRVTESVKSQDAGMIESYGDVKSKEVYTHLNSPETINFHKKDGSLQIE